LITVIGLGFVGLTTALGFADKGFKVYGLDNDILKYQELEKGKVPFYEPMLEDKLKELSETGSFILTKDLEKAVNDSDTVFLCVGTPAGDDGKADLNFVKKAALEAVKNVCNNDIKTIVVKSTVPPGTTMNKLKSFLEDRGVKDNVLLANNPEFLREGCAWQDFTEPDRIVIGISDERSKPSLENYYKSFDAPVFFVSPNTAEFIKYLSNTLLSTMISYANEMSMIADKYGDIDVKKAFNILHMDARWFGEPANMASYAFPGCGFGGYCLPKDTLAINTDAKEMGLESPILSGVLKVNDDVKDFMASKVINNEEKDAKICVLGLSFKPGSDDARDTPAATIIKRLLEAGFTNVSGYDPMAVEEFKRVHNLDINYLDSFSAALADNDVFLIVTAWPDFKMMAQSDKKIYDMRYCLG